MTKKDFVTALTSVMKSRKHTQRQVAAAAGVDQGQLCRILQQDFVRLSSASVRKLAIYADIELAPKCNPRISKALLEAIEAVWDGSKAQEAALARLIRDISALM